MAAFHFIDSTNERSRAWCRDVMQELGWQDESKACFALRAVLQALRDRLTVDEVASLGSQLPVFVRGMYYEGWKPYGKPYRTRHREEYLASVRDYFPGDPGCDIESLTRCVFTVFDRRINEGEIEDIRHLMPEEISELWPSEVPERVATS